MTAQIKRAGCPFGLTSTHVSYQARFIGGKGKSCYHPGKYLNKQLSIWWTALCMWLAWNLPGTPNAWQGNALFKPYWGGWAGSVPAERQICGVRGINCPAHDITIFRQGQPCPVCSSSAATPATEASQFPLAQTSTLLMPFPAGPGFTEALEGFSSRFSSKNQTASFLLTHSHRNIFLISEWLAALSQSWLILFVF